MGGEARLAGVKTLEMRGKEAVWEHEYSFSAMPEAEPREGSVAEFTLRRDFAATAARIDWNRDITRLKFRPYPTLYDYRETLVGQYAYVAGIDSSTPTQLTKRSDPPGSPMSSVRMLTTWRELTRESPLLLLDMARAPAAVTALDPITLAGTSYPALRYDMAPIGSQTEVADWQFIVLFDPDTHLPFRIRTIDGDPIQGSIPFDLELSDWREVEGIKLPFKRLHLHNERLLIDTELSAVTINPDLGPDTFDMPEAAYAVTARASVTEAVSGIPYQWTLRRVKWGGDINCDAIAWDATAQAEPEWVEVLPGIDWTSGVTHNSLMIVMKDFLIIWEASLQENFTEWMIRAAKRRYPDKPIKYLVLSHHHLDHNGGARPFVAEGATIVVPTGPGYEAYFRRMLAADNPELNDRLHRNPREADLLFVDETHTISDGEREFSLYNIKDCDHAPGC